MSQGSQEIQVGFDFDQYPTLLQVQQSTSLFDAVVGPAGSAKTSGIIAMLAIEAMLQPAFFGDPKYPRGVRETRTIVARQSYQQLAKATVSSLQNILGSVGTFTGGKPPTGYVEIPLPDGTTVKWEFLFQALDSDTAAADLRGMEATNAFIDELSEITDPTLVQTLISRLGRYPSALRGGCRNHRALGATNGPKEGHWLHEWSLGKMDGEFAAIEKQLRRRYFRLHRQPAALLRPDVEHADWRPNPLAENVMNLPGGYGYYFGMLAMSDQDVQAFVEGDFAALPIGKRVLTAFSRKLHVIRQDMFRAMWKAGPIVVSFDFGRTPVCLLVVERADGGLIVFDELVDADTSFDAFLQSKVSPAILQTYKGSRVVGGTGDPSGSDESATVATSQFQQALAHGIVLEYPGGSRVDRIAPRIEATQQRLQRLSGEGVPMLLITDNCKLLIDAVERTYVWRTTPGQSDHTQATPTKSHHLWCSDLADALQYLCLWKSNDLASPTKGVVIQNEARPLLAG